MARRTMARFSWLSKTDARATRRRMSFPEAGLAAIPSGREAVRAYPVPRICRASAAMRSAFGTYVCSSTGLKGTGENGAATRPTGASR